MRMFRRFIFSHKFANIFTDTFHVSTEYSKLRRKYCWQSLWRTNENCAIKSVKQVSQLLISKRIEGVS